MIPTNKTLITLAIMTTSILTACGGSDTKKETTIKPTIHEVNTYKEVACKDMLSAPQVSLLTSGSSCGYLTVPEKHALYGKPASTKNIKIAVIKLASTSVNKKADPVVYLEGGPGGSASSSIAQVVETGTFLNDRDVYIVDQRGTGYSKPALFCSEFEEAGTAEQLKACKTRLEAAGIDLTAYHSVHSAMDFIELRKALNISQWNLYGISYGTRLATTIMRENSEGIRSVILDGMFPIEVNGITDTPWANYESLNQVVKNCDNTDGCPADEFKGIIEDIIARMHNEGMIDESREFVQILLELGAEPVIIDYLLAVNEDVSKYASIIETMMAEQGMGEAEGSEVDEQQGEEDKFYNAMGLSTICAEEYPFLNVTALIGENSQGWSASTQVAVGDMYHMGFDKASCEVWNVAPANDIETQAVSSNLPVLMLNGLQDAQTPAAWGILVAQNMPNAQNLTNPQGGHGQLFSDSTCFNTIASDFLAEPNNVVDSSCVDKIPALTYESEEGENSALEQVFSKKTSVFGIPIYGTEQTSDEAMLHAANVMAQYLDNDEDGQPDNALVVEHMLEQGATLIMTKDETEIETLFEKIPESEALQDLYASEVVLAGAGDGFDATIEEVLHLITHVGYAGVYPEVFGEVIGSEIANAMDIARGGQFETIPASYPDSAWYTYDDETCNYSCMVTEYVYWSLTSILGAQAGDERLAQINNEWQLNTLEKVQSKGLAVHALLTNAEYGLATSLPDGDYSAQDFIISPTEADTDEGGGEDGNEEKTASFTFENDDDSADTVYMNGVIGSDTLALMQTLFSTYPQIKTLVMQNVPGSMDDEINLLASMEIRNRGINTHIPADGMVASGGSDMFLAGVKRTIALGARIGVHSWSDGSGKAALDYLKGHQAHDIYLNYYKAIGITTDFYWYTLKAASADSIHWMTAEEMVLYGVLTN
ncbi:alpha/beta fold hydrolase [Colwellia psychrerythraea]|uniref:Proline iminopeptidase n=1 Tax=Colwellia psychrerythraea TaxID=28229 RepID=A0A099K6Q5_COLPS|nr:alpha/beta fold hydrolase [Colwellia psychrerythraea]KGJ86479.1 TAP domain protein [Colwellia psychrerythraea]